MSGVAATLLMPTYRQERYVARAVDSVLRQTGTRLRIVISDDASPDGTWAEIGRAVQGYDGPHELVVRRNQTNLGVDHFNQLFAAVETEVIVMAHGDDIAFPHRAAVLARHLSGGGVMMVSSNSAVIDRDNRIAGLNAPLGEPRAITLEDIARNGWMVGMNAAGSGFRRAVIERFGPLDPQRMPGYGFDHILPFRACLIGDYRYLCEPLLFKRAHPDSVTRINIDHEHGGDVLLESARARDTGLALYQLDTLHEFRQRHPDSTRLARVRDALIFHILGMTRTWVSARNALQARKLRPYWLDKPPTASETTRFAIPPTGTPAPDLPQPLKQRLAKLMVGAPAASPDTASVTAVEALVAEARYQEASDLAALLQPHDAERWAALRRLAGEGD